MEFLLVSLVVCACVMTVLQLAFITHVLNTLRDCASDAARYGALDNRTPDDGSVRARRVVQHSLASGLVKDIEAREVVYAGASAVEVTITAAMPMLGPWGGPVRLRAVGHGIRDAQ